MPTAQRPVPLPSRTVPTAPSGSAARALPAGAVKMSRTWLDDNGLPQKGSQPVPVGDDDRRTDHVRYSCRGHIEVDGVRQPCDHVQWLRPGEPAKFCPDHGVKPEASEQVQRGPLLPWPQMWRAVEPSARPLWVLLVEAAAGIGEHAGHVPWWAPLAATPAVAGAAYWQVRRYLRRRAEKHEHLEPGERSGRRWETVCHRARTAGYVGVAGGAWLTLAATVDPTTLPGAVAWPATLVPAWALSSAPWWRYLAELRNRPEPGRPAAAPVVEAKPSADQIDAAEAARIWAGEVALAGTALEVATWKRIACGWQAVVVATKRGALNGLGGDNMKATIRRIAAAFDAPKSAVTWIEEHDDSPNKALLLVQPNNPLKDGQVWPGPASVDIVKGVAEAGRLIDGTPMVERLYRYGWGAPSEIVLGTTGAGKSERVRKRLVIERYASFVDPTGARRGTFISILHDPKRLEAYAEFRNAVHGYGITRDDAYLIVDALLREMFRRYDYLATLRWTDRKNRERTGGVPWNPLVHGPVISAFWDEFHELAGDAEFVKKLEKLARYQRACGMRATIASHMGTLGDTGSQALRDLLAGGRAVLLRTTSGLNAPLATGGQLTGDPRTLPKVPGMCFVADGDTPSMLGRESYIPSSEDDDTLYDYLFDDGNRPIGYPAEIPPETAAAFGPEFMEWMAAGRRDGGREAKPWTPAPAATAADDLSAQDALKRILFEAAGPLRRIQIGEHPLWGSRATTSTMGAALRAGLEATPPWLVRVGKAPAVAYELSAAAREEFGARLAEAAA